MINALSFDIEEYFHAEAFAGVVRPEDWPFLESRVVRTTERLLEVLGETGSIGTFFVLGWVAERKPELVQAIKAQGHEIACFADVLVPPNLITGARIDQFKTQSQLVGVLRDAAVQNRLHRQF